MTKDEFLIVAKRFLRGFISGGVASVVAMLASGVTITSVEDLKKFGVALATAFATGGLLAIDKMLRLDESKA